MCLVGKLLEISKKAKGNVHTLTLPLRKHYLYISSLVYKCVSVRQEGTEKKYFSISEGKVFLVLLVHVHILWTCRT